jgi:nucleotide-binding universal stress UspA family protein
MYKVLIPTDFSAYSLYALEFASYLTRVKYGKLYIVHIANNKSKLEEIKPKLEEIKAYDFLDGIDYEIILEKGHNISKTINNLGVKIEIDIIVMGTKGSSNVEEMILGGITEHVIRKTQYKVLTLKHKMLDYKIGSILFPSDFSLESYNVFNTVKEFARLFGSKIFLLRVNTAYNYEDETSVKDKMEKLIEHYHLAKENFKYETIIKSDKTEELGILNCCMDKDINLIAIGSHGKNVLKKLLTESTSQDIVRDAFRPVLTIRF